jgi:alcohol dehydrogenase class IV
MVTIAMPTVLRVMEKHVPEKTKAIAEALGAKPGQTAGDVVEAMNAGVGIPPTMRALGYRGGDLDEMAQDAAKSHFLGRSPYRPSAPEFRTMLATVMG